MIVTAPAGSQVRVFVREADGYIDALIRAETKADWDAAAVAGGLVVDGKPVPGASIDEIGAVVLSPATVEVGANGQFTETAPATIDTRHHVNLRLDPSLGWQPLALQWTFQGSPDPDTNNDEVCHVINRVGLIDPDTVTLPKRVWF